MRRLALVVLLCLLVTGCAYSKVVSLPTGDSAFKIKCVTRLDGEGGMSDCLEKAADVCPDGYEFTAVSTSKGSVAVHCPGKSFGLLQYGLWCEMVIKCQPSESKSN